MVFSLDIQSDSLLCLKISNFSGSKRKIVEKIRLPTKYITGVSFGGPNSNILFVTTANLPMNFLTGDIGGALPAPAGSLFQIPLKVKGVRTYLPRL